MRLRRGTPAPESFPKANQTFRLDPSVIQPDVLGALAVMSAPGYGGVQKGIRLKDLAARTRRSESSVALTMRYAVRGGYARLTSPLTDQAGWVLTEAGGRWLETRIKGA